MIESPSNLASAAAKPVFVARIAVADMLLRELSALTVGKLADIEEFLNTVGDYHPLKVGRS